MEKWICSAEGRAIGNGAEGQSGNRLPRSSFVTNAGAAACSKLVIERVRNPIPSLLQGWKERFALLCKEQREIGPVCPLGVSAGFPVCLGAVEGGRAPALAHGK